MDFFEEQTKLKSGNSILVCFSKKVLASKKLCTLNNRYMRLFDVLILNSIFQCFICCLFEYKTKY